MLNLYDNCQVFNGKRKIFHNIATFKNFSEINIP